MLLSRLTYTTKYIIMITLHPTSITKQISHINGHVIKRLNVQKHYWLL